MAKRKEETGYGKPPKASQFKSGLSGNPKGRPKGSKGLKTDLKAQLSTRVSVTEKGKTKKLRVQELLLKMLATKAANGNIHAAKLLLDMGIQMIGIEDQGSGKKGLSPNDQALFDDYLRAAMEALPQSPAQNKPEDTTAGSSHEDKIPPDASTNDQADNTPEDAPEDPKA